MKEQKTARVFSPLFYCLLLFTAILYIRIFSSTPYSAYDDFWWGRDIGMEAFLTGSVNSRYVGNLLEIIVTRSEFLKVVLHGLIATAIPFFIAALVKAGTRPCPDLNGKAGRLPEAVLLLSNVLFLTIPMDVWQETYGWIAGFSNYGLAVFFLAVFQLLVFRLVMDEVPNLSVPAGIGYFLFGICVQLVLENVTVYVFLVDVISLIIMMIKKRSKAAKQRMLLMLAGNTIGIFIMFSSDVYQSLLRSGTAVYGYRRLSFDWHDSLMNIIRVLGERFMYYYPHRTFGANWLMCGLVCILLFLLAGRGKWLVRVGVRLFTAFFFVYFVFTHFYGLLEYRISRWSEMYTQWLNMLFFCGVFLSVLLLPWSGARMRIILIFVWLSVLGIIAPMVAIKVVGSRYFFISSLFLIEFGMFLLAEAYRYWGKGCRRAAECLILLAWLIVSIHRFVIYYDIGQGKKERDALIRAARNGESDRLYFEELPHGEYVHLSEPPDDDPGNIVNFFDFYKIPDTVEFHNSLEDFSPEK